MPYYRLVPRLEEDVAVLDAGPTLDKKFHNWLDPNPWKIKVPEPLDVIVEEKGRLLSFYDNPMPLITENILTALRKIGVDNIDDYAVRLTNPFNGKVYDNYRALKIIGAIEGKPNGQPLFRLAKSIDCIAVSQAVVDVITSEVDSNNFYFVPLFIDD